MMLRKDGIEPAPANKDSDTNQNYAKPLVSGNGIAGNGNGCRMKDGG